MTTKVVSILLFLIIFAGGYLLVVKKDNSKSLIPSPSPISVTFSVSPVPVPTPTPTPSPSPSPSPQPSPDPKVYGPCSRVPVLLYHHVQPPEESLAKKQKSLSVNNDIFASQMQYLVSRGYHTLTPDEFLADLSTGSFPGRSILLTFDDGYADFYTYAYPELVKNNLRATSFLPTGLVGNPDYLNWGQISEMKNSGLITFADHTWSHKNIGTGPEEAIRYEITTAKAQLEEHGLGPVTTFAYPYGFGGAVAKKVLSEVGIKTAFTTNPGWYQCAKLPYDLRRNRVGNSSLSSYGL